MRDLIHNLEARRMLSAAIDPVTKILSVAGTNNGDQIRIYIGGSNLDVMVNGRLSTFAMKKIGSIQIDAMSGSDNVSIYSNVKLPATILGGPGNDTLTGGGGNDVIDGGAGADDMYGGTGIDRVDYSSRTATVIVGIGGVADDGEAGEHDNVHSDIEQIAGGSGDDSLTGSGAANTLIGNAGNDTLHGAGGGDLLDGGDGNDSIYGDAGNDTLRGGAGDDQFSGGTGSDWADYSDHDVASPDPNNFVEITSDDDPSDGLYVNGTEVEFDNVHSDVENLIGSNGNDIIGAFDTSPHTLIGRAGDDLIFGGNGADSIDGGVGNDSIIAQDGNDTLIGGPDTLAPGETDDDYLEADDGNDSVMGGAGNDTAIGAVGNDSLDGGPGDDNLAGEVGNDFILGGDGNDTLSGGIDNDTLDGGAGIDSVSGDDGNDVISDPGTIVPPDDSGDDSSGDSSGGDITPADATLLTIDSLDGGTGDDSLTGGAGSSFIFGGDGNDTVSGGDGPEQINLGLGDDSCDAGGGDDIINGDFGDDTLNGDDGNDTFVNADGQADSIDGGDGIDLVQFELSGIDTTNNTEDVYDQPVDDADLPPPPNPEESVTPLLITKAAQIKPLVSTPVTPVSVVKGVLQISGQADANGAPMNDNISLSQSGTTITVVENGTSYPVSTKGLTGILIDAGSGNDFVALATSTGKSTISLRSTILGGKGDDVLRGGNGSDSIIGGLGNDSIAGNAGEDYLNGGLEAANSDADGTDTIMGGAGEDRVLYTYRTTPLSLSLDGVAHSGASGENDLIGADVEDCLGGRGNDSITGNASRNVLSGGTGSDTIHGLSGNDYIIGSCSGDSGDSLFGDAGVDQIEMRGDLKADRYDLGADSGLPDRDVAPGGGFLDNPI